jgi:hypothetical protein
MNCLLRPLDGRFPVVNGVINYSWIGREPFISLPRPSAELPRHFIE